MECFRIRLPIDVAPLPAELRRLGTAGNIASDGLRWLLAHPTEESILQGLRELWSQPEMPLSGLAESLDNVEVCLKGGDIRLVLSGNAGRIGSTECSPPLSKRAIQHCLARLPHQVPPELVQILAQAPGLTVNGAGLLCHPSYFLDPLGRVNAWFADAPQRGNAQRRGLVVPDSSTHLLEFAENGIGDHYVLTIDGGILFHDHEAGGLVHCATNLHQVLGDYFRRPESIYDPYESGWAIRPVVTTLPEDESDPPQLQVTFRERDFHGSAALALAIRGCERALCHPFFPEYPVLGPYRERICRLLKDCRDIVLEGRLPSYEFMSRSLTTVQTAGSYWRTLAEKSGIPRTHEEVFRCALPAIVQACMEPQNHARCDEALRWSASIMLSQHHRTNNDSAPAALSDMDFLESAAKEGDITKEQLQALFNRPLWP